MKNELLFIISVLCRQLTANTQKTKRFNSFEEAYKTMYSKSQFYTFLTHFHI